MSSLWPRPILLPTGASWQGGHRTRSAGQLPRAPLPWSSLGGCGVSCAPCQDWSPGSCVFHRVPVVAPSYARVFTGREIGG
jgi:hypothetical protein